MLSMSRRVDGARWAADSSLKFRVNGVFVNEKMTVSLTVADTLSHGLLHTVIDNVPNIVIHTLSPPHFRRELGAPKL